jgi:glycosyltransferase involved in cell wall biosynthesis
MRLSIIVPAYDIESYLGACLRSLVEQDLDPQDYEILVIDDGSTDRTRTIAKEFSLRHAQISVFSQENQGLSAARNAGIHLARGKYIYFVDGDDYIASHVLARLVEVMDRDGLDVLAFRHQIVGPDDDFPEPRTDYDPSKGIVVGSGSQYMATHHYVNGVWWYILDREFLTKLGLQFEVGRLVEDALFTANVLSGAKRFAYVPVDVYRYVRRPGSIMQKTDDEHVRRLIADYERVVFGLEELRQRLLGSGEATQALLDRLEYRQRAYVFFLIGRLIRSSVPARPILPEALDHIRAIDRYPLKRFPGRDYRGAQYKILTFVYNREILLYPFIRLYRALRRGRPVEFKQG